MRIEVYLDTEDQLIETLTPPEKFRLDTSHISDGEHKLLFKAIDADGTVSWRTMAITVHNGPAIAVHGISDGDILTGEISILANAYGSKIGDEFEPVRMETPSPVPTWAWVLVMCVFAWGAGYVSLELHDHIDAVIAHDTSPPPARAPTDNESDWADLGKQVYGNNCASCHQINGQGLPGVFPSLEGNPVVLAENPTEHIRAVINGVADKIIEGVAYSAPMPPFGATLDDEEIAAVVNHERTQWGNNAPTVTADDVAHARNANTETSSRPESSASTMPSPAANPAAAPEFIWEYTGKDTYNRHCAACHQANGEGLASVFPPLVGNPAVIDKDPNDHIKAVLFGVTNKVINGVNYSAAMQAFAAVLTDEEIAAVVNHERTQWGNEADTVMPADVQALR